MTSRPDLAKIAQELTPAMRDVMSDIDKAGFIAGRRDTLRALARRKLCGHPRYDFAKVTDLGRAVHAELTRPAPRDLTGDPHRPAATTSRRVTVEPMTPTLRARHGLTGDPHRLAVVTSGPLGDLSAIQGTTDDIDEAYRIAAATSVALGAPVLTGSTFRPTVVGADVAAHVLANPANQPTETLEQLAALAAMLTDADRRAILDALPTEDDRLIIESTAVTPNLVSLLWLRRYDDTHFELHGQAAHRMFMLLAEPDFADAMYQGA